MPALHKVLKALITNRYLTVHPAYLTSDQLNTKYVLYVLYVQHTYAQVCTMDTSPALPSKTWSIHNFLKQIVPNVG